MQRCITLIASRAPAEEKPDRLEADIDSSGESDSGGDSGSGGDMEVVQVEERGRGWGRREQWDCESILRFVSAEVLHISCVWVPIWSCVIQYLSSQISAYVFTMQYHRFQLLLTVSLTVFSIRRRASSPFDL